MKGVSPAAAVMLMVSILVPAACGLKGPPVPPPAYRPAAVTDLAFRFENGKLLLNWSIKSQEKQKTAVADGCRVFQAVAPTENAACVGCDIGFKEVALVEVQKDIFGNVQQTQMNTVLTPSAGAVYSYKVVCFTADAGPGPDSNIVNVDIPRE
jgi:predicted small lipoprotein YifL